MSKTITVPADVTLADGTVKTFSVFAAEVWLEDSRAIKVGANASLLKMRRWLDVVAKFDGVVSGDEITLDDQDYAVLKEIVEAPERWYQPVTTALRLLPFSDAVLDAR